VIYNLFSCFFFVLYIIRNSEHNILEKWECYYERKIAHSDDLRFLCDSVEEEVHKYSVFNEQLVL
jgi:hypothetical protein